MLPYIVCEFICMSALLCLQALFPWCPPSPLALRLFLPLLLGSLSSEGNGLMETSLLGWSLPKSFTLCSLFHCGSVSVPV